jgi:hypothetical protein
MLSFHGSKARRFPATDRAFLIAAQDPQLLRIRGGRTVVEGQNDRHLERGECVEWSLSTQDVLNQYTCVSSSLASDSRQIREEQSHSSQQELICYVYRNLRCLR